MASLTGIGTLKGSGEEAFTWKLLMGLWLVSLDFDNVRLPPPTRALKANIAVKENGACRSTEICLHRNEWYSSNCGSAGGLPSPTVLGHSLNLPASPSDIPNPRKILNDN
ncbi:hypothetical protein Y1Q_0024216 [Alligator mississippiensis]|uniref:Uncharacterized protein n=1 Tax=Alligator mississippiensis TaxID=8496 RepID=A0A151NI51_ALLMI|nr:hypothetical protein Y1Q_0024216 [Alligator mississippiensis]